MRVGLALFATLLLLWTLVQQVNQLVAPWHISIYLGALYVAYAALVLPRRIGAVVVFLAGLMCDANTFLLFGTQALLFLGAQTVLAQWRDRLPHEHAVGRVAIAWMANFLLFVAISAIRAHHAPGGTGYWLRCVADLIASQLVLVLVTPWFLALQSAAAGWAATPAHQRRALRY